MPKPNKKAPDIYIDASSVDINKPESLINKYIRDLPDEIYYADWPEYVVSKSILKEFARGTPAHWKYGKRVIDGEDDKTKAMTEGSLFDCLLTSPDTFSSRFAVMGEGLRANTNAALTWAEESTGWTCPEGLKLVADKWQDFLQYIDSVGITLIKNEQIEAAQSMVDSIYKNLDARAILENPDLIKQPSAVIKDEESGLLIKKRDDFLLMQDHIIIDVKTRPLYGAGYWGFRDAIKSFHYDVQDVLYSEIHAQITGIQPEFWFLVIEREPPYLCAMHQISDHADRAEARAILRRWLGIYAECLHRKEWLGYQSGVIQQRGIRLDA